MEIISLTISFLSNSISGRTHALYLQSNSFSLTCKLQPCDKFSRCLSGFRFTLFCDFFLAFITLLENNNKMVLENRVTPLLNNHHRKIKHCNLIVYNLWIVTAPSVDCCNKKKNYFIISFVCIQIKRELLTWLAGVHFK